MKGNSVKFHVMHSMKGGCGKSTCALFWALQQAKKSRDGLAKVLFLDADFKGSALQHLLFRTRDESWWKTVAEAEKKSELLARHGKGAVQGSKLFHEFARPDDYRVEDNLSRYLRDDSVTLSTILQETFSFEPEVAFEKDDDSAEGAELELKVNGYIDFIFAASDYESKEWFRSQEGKITAGIFLYRMEKLLLQILNHGRTDKEGIGQYEHVIIDMPPGYDEYSDMLLGILRKLATKEKKVELHYYGVTTEDIGHMELTRKNIENLMGCNTKYKEFASVNFVLSGVSAVDFSTTGAIGPDQLKSLLGKEGKVYQNKHAVSYHNYCRKPNHHYFAASELNEL